MDEKNKGITFFHMFPKCLSVWLLGGIIFWMTELIFVSTGLLQSVGYRFLRGGMSVAWTTSSAILLEKISTALLLYSLMSFIGAVICAFIVCFIFRKVTEIHTINALIISFFLSFTFFVFTAFWLNIKCLPVLLFSKAVFVNTAFVIACIMFTYLSYKLFIRKSFEAILSGFVAAAFSLNCFMFGGLFLTECLTFRVFSLKAAASIGGLLTLCFALFYLVRLLFRFKPLCRLTLHNITRSIFITSLVLFFLSGAIFVIKKLPVLDSSRMQKLAGPENPSIILIVMDAARADHLSCYGYRRNTSPYIDKIAEEGILFKNVISPSSWTVPSHASMFTGLIPSEHGVGHSSTYLPEKVVALMEILEKEGYRTLAYSNNPWVSFSNGYGPRFDDFQEGWKKHQGSYFYEVVYNELLKFVKRNDPVWQIQDHGAAKTNRYVCKWIEKNNQVPFFVFINYMETHFPHYPYPHNSMYISESLASGDIKKVLRSAIGGGAFILKRERSQEELSLIRALYDGEINYLDRKIGELYETIRKLNMLDNTLFIITSDHGENLGEHGILGHAFGLFNTLLYVPLIIRCPKYFSSGQVVEEKVQTTDIYYTLADAVGLSHNPSSLGLGRSLIKRVKEGDYSEVMVAEHDRPKLTLHQADKLGIDAGYIDKSQRAIIFRDHKFIQTSLGEKELYDLRTDPNESRNLVSEKSEIAVVLENRLQEICENYRPITAERKTTQMDEETASKLKALGYIQ